MAQGVKPEGRIVTRILQQFQHAGKETLVIREPVNAGVEHAVFPLFLAFLCKLAQASAFLARHDRSAEPADRIRCLYAAEFIFVDIHVLTVYG